MMPAPITQYSPTRDLPPGGAALSAAELAQLKALLSRMRAGRGVMGSFQVDNTPDQIVGPSKARRALILCPPSGGAITFSTTPNPTFGTGLNVQPGSPPILLSEDDYG